MKLKHWAGYGCVVAKRVKEDEDSNHMLHIRVVGNHERGLKPLFRDTAYDWLVHRFDKSAPERYDPTKMGVITEEGFTSERNEYGNYTEQCDFFFIY